MERETAHPVRCPPITERETAHPARQQPILAGETLCHSHQKTELPLSSYLLQQSLCKPTENYQSDGEINVKGLCTRRLAFGLNLCHHYMSTTFCFHFETCCVVPATDSEQNLCFGWRFFAPALKKGFLSDVFLCFVSCALGRHYYGPKVKKSIFHNQVFGFSLFFLLLSLWDPSLVNLNFFVPVQYKAWGLRGVR